MSSRQLNIDCEGPLTKNDIAYEIAAAYLPEGDRLFSLLSKYDDFLSLTQDSRFRVPGYKAGDTLKLIVPFLKAYGVTNQIIREYSLKNLRVMPGVKKNLAKIKEILPVFIISTSYQQYVEVFCQALDFPMSDVYYTHLNLDNYKLGKENSFLKKLIKEILPLPLLVLKDIHHPDLAEEKTILRLHQIFWQEIMSSDSGQILREINPMGGYQKTWAIKDSLKKTGNSILETIYIGDSITDQEALREVRKQGGVAVAFNGNLYALQEAEFGCLSVDTDFLLEIVIAFYHQGKEGLQQLSLKFSQGIPQIVYLPTTNREQFIQESESFRKKIRGELIGQLG